MPQAPRRIVSPVAASRKGPKEEIEECADYKHEPQPRKLVVWMKLVLKSANAEQLTRVWEVQDTQLASYIERDTSVA
jgi:hypothetical protein